MRMRTCRSPLSHFLWRDLTKASDKIAELMGKIQKRNFDAHGHYYRGTHVCSLSLPMQARRMYS